MEFDEKLMKRIWLHIEKTDTCWLSNCSLDKNNYARINVNYKNRQFHRLMLFWNDQTKIIEFNDTKKWLACHTCRNTNCVNPEHLYWGTSKQNINDRIKDETNFIGERHPNSKLTEQQVMEIREKREKGIKRVILAKEYGINPPAITKIMQRKTWSYLSNS